jgi:hypothetical protein
MYKSRFFIKVKSHSQESEKDFVTNLYKDVDLPFLPTLGLTLNFDELNLTTSIKKLVWKVNGNYFVCSCDVERPSEPIGRLEKYKWVTTFIDQEYKNNGWLVFEDDDEDEPEI